MQNRRHGGETRLTKSVQAGRPLSCGRSESSELAEAPPGAHSRGAVGGQRALTDLDKKGTDGWEHVGWSSGELATDD